MLDAIEGHGGVVRQMAGDTLTAVFEAAPSAAAQAAQAALEMIELLAMFNAERAASGKPALGQSIGIAGGEVVAGPAGTPRCAAQVWVGAVVQRADRLEALATERGASVLIDATTHVGLAGGLATDALPPAVLPGSAAAVALYALRAG